MVSDAIISLAIAPGCHLKARIGIDVPCASCIYRKSCWFVFLFCSALSHAILVPPCFPQTRITREYLESYGNSRPGKRIDASFHVAFGVGRDSVRTVLPWTPRRWHGSAWHITRVVVQRLPALLHGLRRCDAL